MNSNRSYKKPIPRLSCVSVIIIITSILGGIILFSQFIIDQIAGCTSQLKDEFAQTTLAKEYSDIYLDHLRSEKKINIYSIVWDISRYKGGCKVEASAGTLNITYIGDSFLIKLPEKKILPITKGASILLDYYGGSVDLP
jgi:hypothetical protein